MAYGLEGRYQSYSGMKPLTPIISGIFSGTSRRPGRSSMEELLRMISLTFKWTESKLCRSVHLERSMF